MRRASLTFACALLAVLVSGLSIASAQVVLQENWEAGTGGQLITDPPFGFEGYFGANFANISSTPLHAGWSDKALDGSTAQRDPDGPDPLAPRDVYHRKVIPGMTHQSQTGQFIVRARA